MAISPRIAFDRSAPDLPEWLIRPGEPGWDTARLAWNLAVDQRPAAVALPGSADEVIAAIVLARDHGRRVAGQGTGHGAAPLGPPEDTILLKTTRMRTVTIDPRTRYARAEGGALWQDVTVPAAGTRSPRSRAPRRTSGWSAIRSAEGSAGWPDAADWRRTAFSRSSWSADAAQHHRPTCAKRRSHG
jgi:hypothetical protein